MRQSRCNAQWAATTAAEVIQEEVSDMKKLLAVLIGAVVLTLGASMSRADGFFYGHHGGRGHHGGYSSFGFSFGSPSYSCYSAPVYYAPAPVYYSYPSYSYPAYSYPAYGYSYYSYAPVYSYPSHCW